MNGLGRRGQSSGTVHVTGIPVRAAFARAHQPGALPRRCGLLPDRPAVLFLAGGFGVGPAVEFTESLVRGRPLLIVNPIPGHEQRNAEYLLEMGAAARLVDPADAAFKIQRLFEQPDRLRRMAERARALGRPHAAEEIARCVLREIEAQASRRGDSLHTPSLLSCKV